MKTYYGNEPGHRQKLATAFVSVEDMDQPPKRWVAGKDGVEGIIARGHQLVADATALYGLSTSLGHDDGALEQTIYAMVSGPAGRCPTKRCAVSIGALRSKVSLLIAFC